MLKKIASEDYIKTIASLSLNGNQKTVRITDVSKKLGVSIPAVSDMVKKLVKDGLVINHAYRGVELTEDGYQMGIQLIRNHRLWEVFLVQVLKMPMADIHDEAERLEHAVSERLMERIDAFLGYPTVDPHGNPIPSGSGEIVFQKDEMILLDADVDARYWIRRFGGLDASYLQYISSKGVVIGQSIKVKYKFPDSMVFDVNGFELTVSNDIAVSIFVTQSH